METQTRIDEPTPHGGVYAIAYWYDEFQIPTDRSVATKVEIIEYNSNGDQVWRTYGMVNNQPDNDAGVS